MEGEYVSGKVIYIHGKGGCSSEAEHYIPLFEDREVKGLDYASQTPWEAAEEFPRLFDTVCEGGVPVILIANSIGAYFSMLSLSDRNIEKAFFISPVVDMEKLIKNMMLWANVTEDELRRRGEIETAFGETLSWRYLEYARSHPVSWRIPTHIIYGDRDDLTTPETIRSFAQKTGATLGILSGGGHWFHTEEQMHFIDRQITDNI